MIDHAILPIGHTLAHRVIHEVRRELAGGPSALLQSPDDAVAVPRLVDLHDTDVVLWLQMHILEEFSASGGNKIFALQVVCLHAHGNPLARLLLEPGTALSHLLGTHAVGQVSAISLMPALADTVLTHMNIIFHYLNA